MYEGQEITYQILTNILQCRSPKPLDQEFFVPENYIPPSEEFHQKILKRIKILMINVLLLQALLELVKVRI